MFRRFGLPILVYGVALSCGGFTYYPEVELTPPQIAGVQAPTPTGIGSILTVRGTHFDVLGQNARLLVQSETGDTLGAMISIPESIRTHEAVHEASFLMPAELFAAIGVGDRPLQFRLHGSGMLSGPFISRVQTADLSALASALSADSLPTGDVYRNQIVHVTGLDFLAQNEGRMCAKFIGTFTPSSGTPRQVNAAIPMDVDDPTNRTRAKLLLSTELGGPETGLFSGTVALLSTAWSTQFPSSPSAACENASTRTSALLNVGFRFQNPRISAVHAAVPERTVAATGPARVSIGQYLAIEGDGFLGGKDLVGRESNTEFTTFRIQGTFVPTGGTPIVVSADSARGLMIPDMLDLRGNIANVPMDHIATQEPSVLNRRLVSSRFNASSGTFDGTVTAVTHSGTTELISTAFPLRLELLPTRQVVHVMFLTSFNLALSRFGLAAAADSVRARVIARMTEIYQGVNVELRLLAPTDYRADSYTTVEVGGPDPNGRNLFGLENQIAKDINNLNLGDTVGGYDALAAEAGTDAFGGVFIENVLIWSSHPEIPGLALRANMRPPVAEQALFDSVFDPVRNDPVLAAELLPGNTSAERSQDIARAITALGNIIGATTAHELGHSLGLAQPTVQPTQQGACGRDCVDEWHSMGPAGCLMNAGGGQPLPERMGAPRSTNIHFCGDEVPYLQGILHP